MDFVDRYGGIKTLPLFARGHPTLVVPLIAVEVPYHGSRLRTHLRGKAAGIRFDCDIALIPRLDFVFVELPLGEARDEDLPQAGCSTRPHRMAASIPLVEFSNEADAL